MYYLEKKLWSNSIFLSLVGKQKKGKCYQINGLYVETKFNKWLKICFLNPKVLLYGSFLKKKFSCDEIMKKLHKSKLNWLLL